MNPARSSARSLDTQPHLVVQAWLGSRALIAIVVVWQMVRHDVPFETLAGRWDVSHYADIATRGYVNSLDVAFFPGLPALLRAGVNLGLPIPITGVLLGLVGSALAAAAVYRLSGAVAASLWLIAPTTVFTAFGYTEAVFCAAGFWAWERARAGQWAAAGALAGIACTFRVSGLFLLGALGLLAISQAWRQRDAVADLLRRCVWLLIPVAVLAGYVIYLHELTGSWTAWLDAQNQGWSRRLTNPMDAWRNTMAAANPASWPGRREVSWVFRAELVSMAVGLVTTFWCLAKRRVPEAGWVGVQVLAFATSHWFMSVNRAVLLWFPTFAMLAAGVQWRPRSGPVVRGWRFLVGVAVAIDLALMMVWAWLFITGRWAS